MLANPLKFIEISTDISDIPIVKGQILYDTVNNNFFVDSYNIDRTMSDNIEIRALLDEIGDPKKIYYYTTDELFYIFNGFTRTYSNVAYLSEVLHLIEPVSTYVGNTIIVTRKKTDSEELETINAAPVSVTNFIYRPTGENLEVYLKELANGIGGTEFYKVIIISEDTSNPTPIPVPYKRWFLVGGSVAVYLDGNLVPTDKYKIDLDTNEITFVDYPDGLPIGSKVEFAFLDTTDNMEVNTETFVSTKNQRSFTLTKFTYTMGISSVEVYVNGIRQTKESYREISPSIIMLNDSIPENSEVLIQVGKLIPSEPDFFDFETKEISAKINDTIITTFPKGRNGEIRTIEETFDSNNNIIQKVAKVNGIEIKRESYKYNSDGSVVIVSK